VVAIRMVLQVFYTRNQHNLNSLILSRNQYETNPALISFHFTTVYYTNRYHRHLDTFWIFIL